MLIVNCVPFAGYVVNCFPFTGYFVVCPLPGNCVPFARSLLKVCHLIDLCYLCALRSIFVNWVAFFRTLLTVCPLLDLSRTLNKMGTTHDLLSIYLPYRPGFEMVIFQLNDLAITPKVKKKRKKKKKEKKTKFMEPPPPSRSPPPTHTYSPSPDWSQRCKKSFSHFTTIKYFTVCLKHQRDREQNR